MKFDIKDVRPWWWWINPWLYIKRRDIAYVDCLDTIYELVMELDARPKAKGRYDRDWEPRP